MYIYSIECKNVIKTIYIYQLYDMLSRVRFTAKHDSTGGIELNLLCDKFNDDNCELLDLTSEVSSALAICSIISIV